MIFTVPGLDVSCCCQQFSSFSLTFHSPWELGVSNRPAYLAVSCPCQMFIKMFNKIGLERSPRRPELFRILHFQIRWLHFGDQKEAFFKFSLPHLASALSLPCRGQRFPLHNSLPNPEDDAWSSEATSFVFLLTKSCFLFPPDNPCLLFDPVGQLSGQSRK